MTPSEFAHADLVAMLKAYDYSSETISTVIDEHLLPEGLINRLHRNFTRDSGFIPKRKPLFVGKNRYVGLKGFREIVAILNAEGISIDRLPEREFFLEVYRFMATKHILNRIDWSAFRSDPLFYLVFPQPDMIPEEETARYLRAQSDEERATVVDAYRQKTNPHDGNQKLNKPYFFNSRNELEILQGSQHKYPPISLVLDEQTQNCFAFCTYCFRHAQVRGDEDMFVQHNVGQVLAYLRQHREVTDVLITGGDGGYISLQRLKSYLQPIIEEDALAHIRTLRIGSRVLTFHPEFLLGMRFREILEYLQEVADHGVQIIWMSHFSTPRELLNPGTVAAIRRLKKFGITVKSQSPIMNHISLYYAEDGTLDKERSAQNWIDLGNILGMLGVGFHSMYCARPTGEHHYFSAPLADINRVFSRLFRGLSSVNRPSRYITMTSSAGKTSLMGTAEINGEKVFVLKFNEARNMEWIDRVYFAHFDPEQRVIEKLKPYGATTYFYEEELEEIEHRLERLIEKENKKEHHD